MYSDTSPFSIPWLDYERATIVIYYHNNDLRRNLRWVGWTSKGSFTRPISEADFAFS